MPLQPGTLLGQYEVLSSLGAGGMGEVYRAKDRTLGREVAVKLLLDEVAADPERLARFEREARVLASLNHPNLATLHGFFTAAPVADGGGPEPQESGEVPFLVMELVEGETLADRIARGPIPLAEAIPIFVQIADGLEAAHRAGVIHRDLKPANVKLSMAGAASAGGVKILDFGLAKAMASGAESDPSESPTITQVASYAATRQGQILGTAAYMSPEQAKGRELDRRADVWALGVCLYEALTGRRAFQADDAADT
ncbi:MAG: serine/threonine-protein kinase, partial [Thermoanaerobaculia bacterium]|nr:serine/threonine-protein kinase [Thermoanaerobaculia bacterium]